MVIAVPISELTEQRLAAKARLAGVDVETYAARQLDLLAQPVRPLEEISGPIAEAVRASGASEDEMAAFLESEKHAMRRESSRRASRDPRRV